VFNADVASLPLADDVRVGTGAARRRAQLAALRPDLQPTDMRGNLDTRLRKLRHGDADALLLAMAGLDRLKPDLSGLHVVPLEPEVFMPAPAQGALALEIRRDNSELDGILSDLHDVQGHPAVAAERGLMAMLEGGCQLELGAHAHKQHGRVHLAAWYRGRQAEAEERNAEEAAMRVYQHLTHPAEGGA
jgi:hydroxymethylbilane synthase